MHELEPYYKWRELYVASEDTRSPFYGRTYSEFSFQQKVYNYYIHPQWDTVGSETLYVKVLYADYDDGYAIIECIGEWNDLIENDVMFFRDNLLSGLIIEGVHKFIILGENIMNFHGEDDSYYEEWYEDIADEDGWICMLELRDHVMDEMKQVGIHNYINFGAQYNELPWRKLKPENLFRLLDEQINGILKLD